MKVAGSRYGPVAQAVLGWISVVPSSSLESYLSDKESMRQGTESADRDGELHIFRTANTSGGMPQKTITRENWEFDGLAYRKACPYYIKQ